MLSHSKSTAVAGMLAAGALLAGCGGSSGTSTGPAPATPSPAQTPSGPTSSGGPSASPSNPSTAPTSPAPATEFNPPGDIPDNQAFVSYSPPGAPFSVKVPEGWSRSMSGGGAVTFTDKLNSITMQTVRAPSPPTPSSVRNSELPGIASSVAQYAPGRISRVSRTAGPAVLVTYEQDSAPDPVTNKVVRDAVERYEFWRAGKEVILTLSGPKGADNVDPWRIVTDSLRWRGR